MPADLSAGNRELLQTLAIEASTILENARLMEEERAKMRIENELQVARDIQQGLLPASMPLDGWFRAAGSSQPSTQVGGDYFDVRQITPGSVGRSGGRCVRQRRQLRVAGRAAARRVPDGVGESARSGRHAVAAQLVSAGSDARRKIRHRVLLHAGFVRASALCQRGALRAVSGERGWASAQAAHLRNAGGNDRGRCGCRWWKCNSRRATKW